MRDLHVISKARRIPITRLIADGVRQHVAALRDEMDQPEQKRQPATIGFRVISEITDSAA